LWDALWLWQFRNFVAMVEQHRRALLDHVPKQVSLISEAVVHPLPSTHVVSRAPTWYDRRQTNQMRI